MKVEVKLEGLNGVLETLKQLPPTIVSKNGGPVRAALRKGAMVIVKEARSNFRRSVAIVGKMDQNFSTGFTEKQIVAKRKAPPVGVNGERFVISVNYVEHPNGNVRRRKRAFRANDAAFIMEYGSVNQQAHPWLRPAFDAKAAEAMMTISDDLRKRVDKIVANLAQKNQGKK
jgi:hypothetical protein